VCGAIRDGLLDGILDCLVTGEALPSITYLTGETGLAVGTVRKAIGVLVDEGLAYTVPGRGTFASPRKN
jgi:DNA-binding GntR family transcriptional regulator